MTRKVICDNCGETDDWGSPPCFLDGVVLQFREECGSQIEQELELCPDCKRLLLAALPKLQGLLSDRE